MDFYYKCSLLVLEYYFEIPLIILHTYTNEIRQDAILSSFKPSWECMFQTQIAVPGKARQGRVHLHCWVWTQVAKSKVTRFKTKFSFFAVCVFKGFSQSDFIGFLLFLSFQWHPVVNATASGAPFRHASFTDWYTQNNSSVLICYDTNCLIFSQTVVLTCIFIFVSLTSYK